MIDSHSDNKQSTVGALDQEQTVREDTFPYDSGKLVVIQVTIRNLSPCCYVVMMKWAQIQLPDFAKQMYLPILSRYIIIFPEA